MRYELAGGRGRRGVMAAVVWLAFAAVLVAPQVASAAKWTIQTTPVLSSKVNITELNGVSCTSSTFCMAVGSYEGVGSGGERASLVEKWNGSEWTAQIQTTKGALQAVSCVSSTSCAAVGYQVTTEGRYEALAEYWNGSEWKLNGVSGGVEVAELRGVSCVSAGNCTAVGRGEEGSNEVMARRWNGTSWVAQYADQEVGGKKAVLNSVSCASAKICVAVGSYENSSGKRATLAERWNGELKEIEAWESEFPPNTSETANNQLRSVSCASAESACMAVGSNGSGMLIEKRSPGGGWSMATNPTGATSSEELLGVSCTAATACIATGQNTGAKAVTPVAIGWNGTEWTLQSAAKVEGEVVTLLSGVSCTTATTCTSVGSVYNKKTGSTSALVERYE